MCECDKGFQFDSQRKNCVDVNECLSRKRNRCEQNCINEEGTYSCSCNEDFELSSDGFRCTPSPKGICAHNPCHNSGKCLIDEHSFHCECQKGFTGRLCHQNVQLELPNFVNINTEDNKGFKIGV
ncbi:unnamed protein product [Oikopleura dioica]|uniref:EGF-like domain-containing protein n=1 Tax=Oikopleura dioica TaxID=34765 RepID=E4Z5X2_OIKDI|nr:unnamed protein product [Oikopleura dioica]